MEPPEEFDGFRVVRPLGRGGMGTVYLGHDTSLDRPVALKFIASKSPDRKSRDRFLVEARAIARLQHPNVVGIYRIGEVLGNPYIAYELIAGVPLHEMPRPLPWRRALGIGVAISRGLAAAHRRGVLHRDIKPANIIEIEGGDAKLLDFGLAKLDAEPPEEEPDAPDPEEATDPGFAPFVTSAGKLAGTPAYMAPELWHGEPATVRSDLFSLGLVLYELLAGALPWSGGRHHEPRTDAAPIAERRPDVPRPLAAAIDRLIRRDPRERFATAEEARDTLETVASVYGSFTEHEQPPAADEEAERIAASFGRAAPEADPFAAAFYDRLFSIRPDLRPLFPRDMGALRHKVVNVLHLIVRNLRTPEKIVPMLDDLGARHAHYGARVAHFEHLGQALLGTLAEHDRASWTPALEAAWRHAFDRMAATMARGLERELATGSSAARPAETGAVQAWTAAAAPPQTRYAKRGEHAIAYQVIGGGPLDLLFVPGWVSHVEQAWNDPSYARFLRRLASRARVILVDKLGTGLSDRIAGERSIDERAGDLVAVLNAAQADRAAILGISDAAAVAAHLGATAPDRARALVLYGGAPRMAAADDYPEGLAPEVLEAAYGAIRDRWGEPLFLGDEAPSRAGDQTFAAWWAAYLRTAASPSAALAMLRESASFDVRGVLPEIAVPTLVLHRRGDRMMPFAGGRRLAASIAHARLVELDGEDHLPFTGDADRIVDEVLRFVLDLPTEAGSQDPG